MKMSYIGVLMMVVMLVLPTIFLFNLWTRMRRRSSYKSNNKNANDMTQPLDSTSLFAASSITRSDSPDSSLSLSLPSVEYEVFLSFRGPDTRSQITDILYRFLVHSKIHTFKDDDELRKGEGIWSTLVKVINQSKIYVPIISKNYAYSKWCLKELVEIVKQQRKDNRHIILPIFYMVNPRDVRHQTGPYQNAFLEHANTFDELTIQNWRDALNEVGALKGWHVKTIDEQGAIADEVSAHIWSHISKTNYVLDTDELVGIDHHIEAVLEKLSLDSNNMTMVGIHGIGGIGKTTIARAVYNKISYSFDRCCFVENIRETQQQKDGILIVQKKLISDILRKDSNGISNNSEGRKMIRERVSELKILVILDDVDEKFDFEDILGSPRNFHRGSRFIVTSRNVKILSILNETQCNLYEVQTMSHSQALQLFCMHSLRKSSPPPEYKSLADDIVSSTGRLPLTLKVIGTLLFREDIPIWKEKLKRLQGTLELQVISMIKVGDDDKFRIHDQLRDMGREIVRQENIDRPWMRSRIWSAEEGMELLYNQKGTTKVKALVVPSTTYVREFISDCFYNLQGLRYFEADITITGDFSYLLPNLRWLRLCQYGQTGFYFRPLPNFDMRNMVILDFRGVILTDYWGGWNQIEMSNKLKVVKLAYCFNITRLPYFPSSLEMLTISFMNVICMPKLHIGRLKKLKFLALRYCNIRRISGGTFGMLKGLVRLDLDYFICENLREVFVDVGDLTSLKILRTIGVKDMDFEAPKGLKELSTSSRVSNLAEMLELEALYVCDCEDGFDIPLAWWKVSKLKSLFLMKSKINSTSTTTSDVGLPPLLPSSLTNLQIKDCRDFVNLPSLVNLENVSRLEISECQTYCGHLYGIEALKSLKSLTLTSVKGLTRIHGFGDLLSWYGCKLEELTIWHCNDLTDILSLELEAHTIIRSLTYMSIDECPQLEVGPLIRAIAKFPMLKYLKLWTRNINSIHGEDLKGLGLLEELVSLRLNEMSPSVERIASLSRLQKLKKLRILRAPRLREIEGLGELKSLENLRLIQCPSFGRIWHVVQQLSELKVLDIRECRSLSVDDLSALKTSLQPNLHVIWPDDPYEDFEFKTPANSDGARGRAPWARTHDPLHQNN
ncbi:Disease resistance protein L6 [Linum perenne]